MAPYNHSKRHASRSRPLERINFLCIRVRMRKMNTGLVAKPQHCMSTSKVDTYILRVNVESVTALAAGRQFLLRFSWVLGVSVGLKRARMCFGLADWIYTAFVKRSACVAQVASEAGVLHFQILSTTFGKTHLGHFYNKINSLLIFSFGCKPRRQLLS